jgi:hypothetical protein
MHSRTPSVTGIAAACLTGPRHTTRIRGRRGLRGYVQRYEDAAAVVIILQLSSHSRHFRVCVLDLGRLQEGHA